PADPQLGRRHGGSGDGRPRGRDPELQQQPGVATPLQPERGPAGHVLAPTLLGCEERSMNTSRERARPEGRGRRLRLPLVLCASALLAGCSDLLEVELPAELTDSALEDPNGAITQVNSIIV